MRMRWLCGILAIGLAAAILSVINAKAFASTTLTVPGEFPTIQAALNAALPGNTVSVSPGTFPENLNFQGKAVSLVSTGGASQTTIAAPGGTAVTIGPAGSIAGFTISGGTATFGAGMAVSGSGTVIANDIFQSNQEGFGGFGAAIGGNSASPVIEQDLFTGNSCDDQFLSGVVAFVNDSSPTIENNVFHDNPCRAVNLTLPQGDTPLIINNTMVRNSVGVRVDGRIPSGTEVGRNNIVADNGIGLEVDFGSGPTWDHNLVFGNTQNYSGIADQTGANGNLSADPLFVNSGSDDFRLLQGSPALGAGSAVDAPSVDFNGNPRPPGSIDIGAFQGAVVSDNDLQIADHAPVSVDATSPAGAVVTYVAPAASDPDDSAPPSVSCSPSSGASFQIGQTVVTCTATDPDDSNSPQSSQFTVTVRGAADQLADLAKAVQGVGSGTSLADKVAQAQSDLGSGDVTDACGTLGAFGNEVQAESGVTIPPATAQQLIADAQRIQAVLAC
jgi:serine protease